jgi:hypothetical protein
LALNRTSRIRPGLVGKRGGELLRRDLFGFR